MSKEIELRAADDLAAQINKGHEEVLAKVVEVKSAAADIGIIANHVGMLLSSARDTVGDSFHHWLRERIEMPSVAVERYIRHHRNYHPGQLFLPGFKALEDRASVQAQAEANAETAEGDTPTKDEVPEVSVRDIAAGWVYDARRWFSQLLVKMPPDKMSADQIEETLRVVKPVRDAIYAYEQRYVQLKGQS
jgi:hypothetical protein